MTIENPVAVTDHVTCSLGRNRTADDLVTVKGLVTFEIWDEHGALKHRSVTHNLVTAVGDRLIASRAGGLTTSALPLGMKLGTSSTAVTKTGAGAALVAYLTNSHQAFDATFPSEAAGVITYKVSYAAGKATSASAITEAVIYTDTTADATSTVANTVARALLAGVPSKGASDTAALVWTWTILGS